MTYKPNPEVGLAMQAGLIEHLQSERDDYKARALQYERTNAEQAAMLNAVIAERGRLMEALEKLVEVYDAMGAPRGPSRIVAEAAIAKVQP